MPARNRFNILLCSTIFPYANVYVIFLLFYAHSGITTIGSSAIGQPCLEQFNIAAHNFIGGAKFPKGGI